MKYIVIDLNEITINDVYGEEIKVINSVQVPGGVVSLEEYRKGQCKVCKRYEKRNSRYQWHGGTYCSRCAEKTCDVCGKPGTHLCPECVIKTEVTHCPACNERHSIHTTCMCQGIKQYSYKPIPLFKWAERETQKAITYGMEVEIDYNDDQYSSMGSSGVTQLAVDLQKQSKGHMYAKEDSSINGFEMVFHPVSIKYLRQNNIIKHILQKVLSTHPSQRNAGFHVHIGKEHLSPLALYKIYKDLLLPETQIELLRLSKRTIPNIQEWAQFTNMPYAPYLAKEKRPTDKHQIIAVTEKTIEFRLFNGIKDPSEPLENLLVVRDIISWAKYGNGECTLGEYLIKHEKERKKCVY